MRCFFRLAVYGKCQHCTKKNRSSQVRRVKNKGEAFPLSFGFKPDIHHFLYNLSENVVNHTQMLLHLTRERLKKDGFLKYENS